MIDGLKPYPAMKDSGVPWLGEVPEHWEVRRLKHIARLAYGNSLATEARQQGAVPVFGSNGRVGFHSVSNTKAPCIVIGRKGSFGKVNFSADPVFAIDTTFLVDSRFTSSDVRWLFYLFGYLRLDEVSRDSAVPGLDREEAYQRLAALPPLPEQAAIVPFLDHADRRIRRYIRAKQKLIKLLAEQKQAIIHRAVTRGLDPNVRLKPSGVEWLGDVPEHWEVKPIGGLCTYISYGFTNPMPATDEGPYMLTANDIGDDRICYETARRTAHDAFNRLLTKKSRPVFGDVLVTKDGTLGRVAVSDGRPACINQSVALLRVDRNQILPEYLSMTLRGPLYQERMVFDAGGTAIKHIYITRLAKMRIPYPPLREQAEILTHHVHHVGYLGRAAASAHRGISLLREYRTRLIADVVTGKLDVREAAARLPDEADEPEALQDTDTLTEGDNETDEADRNAVPNEAEA